MDSTKVKAAVMALGFLFLYTILHAQKAAYPGTVWKKEVARIIDIKVSDDTLKHHLRNVRYDTTLLEMVIKRVRAGKLAAYSNYDHSFTVKLSPKDLDNELILADDTAFVVDPVSGKEVMRIIHHDFNYDVVTKYRILEEWTFTPATGKTDIQIVGIAPIKEVYIDGEFRGTKALFWLKYHDVVDLIARYEQYSPGNSFALHIWDDYFLSDVKPGVQK